MGTAEVIKYLDDNQFGKKSYRELSAKSNKSVSLLLSDKTEAYDFDDITKYIFPKYTPSSADAILIKTNKIILIEFKGGFERKISEDNLAVLHKVIRHAYRCHPPFLTAAAKWGIRPPPR